MLISTTITRFFIATFALLLKIISFFFFQTTLNLIFMVRFKRLRQEKFPLSSSFWRAKSLFRFHFSSEKKMEKKKQRDTISLGIMFANKNETIVGEVEKEGKKTNCCCTINHKKKPSLGLWCKLSSECEVHERNKYSTRHTRNQIINVASSCNRYPSKAEPSQSNMLNL